MKLQVMTKWVLASTFTIALLALPARAQSNSSGANADPKLEPVKEKAVQGLDARIQNLQSAKDCISNAKNRGDVSGCRSNLRIQQKNVRVNETN